MTDEEKEAFRKYGRVPQRPGLINKVQDRKFFDSGDYMMNKAGKTAVSVGSQIPSPEDVHHTPPMKSPSAMSPKLEHHLLDTTSDVLGE
jgi:hypothetical protein